MSVPTSNLLNQAFGLIQTVPFDYYRFDSRSVNSIGLYVSQYATPVTLFGSIQAVDRSVYAQFGLDFQKRYITVFVSANMMDIGRETSGDQIEWNGRRWQLLSDMPWFAIDGWLSVLCVDVTDDVVMP